MSTRYTPLPNLPLALDAERELDDAFESDNEDDGNLENESSPLTHDNCHTPTHRSNGDATSSVPGAYDFEREYDYPPPGSPPRPSTRALPNDYGNSNGLLPTSPIHTPIRGPSFFRRTVGAVLPTHYIQVATEAQPSRTVGGGIENDGVFANVMAKPQRARVVQTENGDVRMVPEDIQKEAPPSYADAQADSVPPYWETTVHAPAALDPAADMIIDDLPTGSAWIFGLNIFISFFFQFVGFLLTYLLHTSHAAKYGSRAGLGLTLIQFGFYSRTLNLSDADETTADGGLSSETSTSSDDEDGVFRAMSSKDWLSFLLMTLGWFLILSSLINFWRVKRWEKSIRSASAPVTPEAIERDIAVRRNIEQVFGISFAENPRHRVRDEDESALMQARVLQEAQLTRDLRAAGLL